MRVNPLQAAGQAYVDAEEQYLVAASRHLQAKRRCDVLELETMVFTEDGRGYETQCDEAREALRQAEAELRASTCRLTEHLPSRGARCIKGGQLDPRQRDPERVARALALGARPGSRPRRASSPRHRRHRGRRTHRWHHPGRLPGPEARSLDPLDTHHARLRPGGRRAGRRIPRQRSRGRRVGHLHATGSDGAPPERPGHPSAAGSTHRACDLSPEGLRARRAPCGRIGARCRLRRTPIHEHRTEMEAGSRSQL